MGFMCDLGEEAYYKGICVLGINDIVKGKGRAVYVEGHGSNKCGPEKARCYVENSNGISLANRQV